MSGGGLLRALAGRFRAALVGRIRYGGGRAHGGGGGPAPRGGHVVTTHGSHGESGRGANKGGDSYGGQGSYQAGGSCGGRTGEGGRGSYQGEGSYGGRSGGDGAGHGHGSARGGRGSEHEQANGFWGGLRRRLKKTLDERDLVEDLEELHYRVEQIKRFQNLPERISAIGQKCHDHWVTVSLALSTIYATISGKFQDQVVSVKAKMIGVKDKLKERLSPQKFRANHDQPEDEPIAIPLATDFSP